MKRCLFLVILFFFLGSAAVAATKSKKPVKPWHAVPLPEVRISAERTTDQMEAQQVVIYGNGVAVWNNQVQFQLDEARLKRILAAFDAARFDTIPQSEEGEHLHRRAEIRAGDYDREVIETFEGERERLEKGTAERTEKRAEERKRDPALEKVVDSIFTIVAPVAEKGGVTAESLSDGLRKVASGTLAPETLSLIVLVKAELGRSERSDGFLLRIEDGAASSSRYEKQTFSQPRRTKLSQSDIRDIASRLLSFDPDHFPINLYASDYEDVTIRVMNQHKNVLARQFAGLSPTKYGEMQTRYESMMAWLTTTRERLFQQSPASND